MNLSLSSVRSLRKRLGMTQHELAKKVNVSQSLIAKLESGRIDPTYSKGKKILDHLEDMARHAEPPAKELMSKNVVMADGYQLIPQVIDLMKQNGISQIPVIDKDKLTGLITEEVILNSMLKKKQVEKLTARSLASPCPPMVDPQAPRSVVAGLLRHYPAVFVVEEGVLLGIITKSDILANL